MSERDIARLMYELKVARRSFRKSLRLVRECSLDDEARELLGEEAGEVCKLGAVVLDELRGEG